jgi:AraC-like DNA-binding protein
MQNLTAKPGRLPAANRTILESGVSADRWPSADLSKRPPEPSFLKRSDHCGVSWRTLQGAFIDFRGLTPVAHVRNVRLDHARAALETEDVSVAAIAARFGFRSSTTFALGRRKWLGAPPGRVYRGRT